MGQLPGQQNWLEWQSKKWFKWDHNGAPSVWSKQNLNMAKYNVIEIEGLLFPGFGQMQVRKFFPSSDVMRALKMELFSWKILSMLMTSHFLTWWENHLTFPWEIGVPQCFVCLTPKQVVPQSASNSTLDSIKGSIQRVMGGTPPPPYEVR